MSKALACGAFMTTHNTTWSPPASITSRSFQNLGPDLSDLIVFRADRAVVPLRVSIGLAIYRLPGASTVIVPICAQRVLRPRAHDSVDSATIVTGPSELLLQPRYA
jgi:hypothetical protein